MFQITAFQVDAFQHVGLAGELPVDEARQPGAGRSRRRRQRRYEVEIDGQVFAVESTAEAEELIAKARDVAEQQARAEAERVVKKRRTASRREKKPLKLDGITLPVPYVKARSEGADELAQRIQAQLDAIYARAARDAEIALRVRRQAELDEEDSIVLFLLSE
jgi:hypothetical protein